jgi:hypothetical protein
LIFFKADPEMLSATFLAYSVKQPDLALLRSQVVNDSKSAAFPATHCAPAQFSNAAGLPNEIPSLRVLIEMVLQARQLIIGKELIGKAREQLGFNEGEHRIRLRRSPSMTDS